MYLSDAVLERYWIKVDKNGPIIREELGQCHIWTAGCRHGYGEFRLDRTTVAQAHILAYIIEYGDVIGDLFVLHKCDNKPCVRPTHLFLGTDQDNATDKANKGRSYRAIGDLNGCAVLTWEKVDEMRSLYPKYTQVQLAAMFGIKQPQVSEIIRNVSWRRE